MMIRRFKIPYFLLLFLLVSALALLWLVTIPRRARSEALDEGRQIVSAIRNYRNIHGKLPENLSNVSVPVDLSGGALETWEYGRVQKDDFLLARRTWGGQVIYRSTEGWSIDKDDGQAGVLIEPDPK